MRTEWDTRFWEYLQFTAVEPTGVENVTGGRFAFRWGFGGVARIYGPDFSRSQLTPRCFARHGVWLFRAETTPKTQVPYARRSAIDPCQIGYSFKFAVAGVTTLLKYWYSLPGKDGQMPFCRSWIQKFSAGCAHRHQGLCIQADYWRL